MTDAERIRYLEESIRELRKEKENLKKEKGELKSRLEKENKKLEEVHNLTIKSKDFFINKLIEERDYWEWKYRELDKLVMQKFWVKLD